MKNFLLLLFIALISCDKNQSQSKNEKIDYKVVQLDFNYLNYLENIKPANAPFYIKHRSLIIIDCTTEKYKVDEIETTKSSIKDEIKAQLGKNKSNANFPLFITTKNEKLGEIEYPKNYSLMLIIKPDINFEEYQSIRKEIFTAINDLRNKLSIEKTGKNLYDLNKSKDEKDIEICNAIFKVYPMNYTENVQK